MHVFCRRTVLCALALTLALTTVVVTTVDASPSRHAPRKLAPVTNGERYDIVVVGGGPIGLATAYYLQSNNWRVAVLETSAIGNPYGSSAGDTRQFRVMYSEPYLSSLAQQSIPLWHDLEDATPGVSRGDILNQDGYLFFGEDATGETTEGSIPNIQRTCVEQDIACTNYDTAGLRGNFTFDNIPNGWVGVWNGDSGDVNVEKTVQSYAELCRSSGRVHIREYEKALNVTLVTATDVGFPADGWLTQDNVALRVTTTRGFLHAAKMVVTPGPYGRDAFRSLLGFDMNLTLWEMPSMYFSLNPDDPNAADKAASLPTWFAFGGDDSELYYGFSMNSIDYPSRVRVAPDFVERPLNWPSERTDVPWQPSLDKTQSFVRDMMPFLDADDVIVPQQTCLASQVPDNGFVLDYAPVAGPITSEELRKKVSIFTAGWAFKFVPAIGLLLAELATEQPRSFPFPNVTTNMTNFLVTRPGVMIDFEPYPSPSASPGAGGGGGDEDDALLPWVLFGVLLAVVVACGVVFLWKRRGRGSSDPADTLPTSSSGMVQLEKV